jgi:hypothetical protein
MKPCLICLLFVVLPAVVLGHTIGVQTNKASGSLKPGEYYWKPELSPSGPVVVVVSLPQQVMVVYRNGVQIARSTVSTGAGKKATPTGVFEILQKKQEHYSNIYNNAPMPYMQRLTWSGIAMHAGKLPGYPASKGCVRLPYDFSQKLYTVTKMGGTVIIANEKSPQTGFAASPGLALGGNKQPQQMQRPQTNLAYQWMPEQSPSGPVTILISGADRELYVYRSGVLIGRGACSCRGNVGEHVFTLLEGTSRQAHPWLAGLSGQRWMEVDPDSGDPGMSPAVLGARLRIAPDFAANLYNFTSPGTTVVVTDEPALSGNAAKTTIVAND